MTERDRERESKKTQTERDKERGLVPEGRVALSFRPQSCYDVRVELPGVRVADHGLEQRQDGVVGQRRPQQVP